MATKKEQSEGKEIRKTQVWKYHQENPGASLNEIAAHFKKIGEFSVSAKTIHGYIHSSIAEILDEPIRKQEEELVGQNNQIPNDPNYRKTMLKTGILYVYGIPVSKIAEVIGVSEWTINKYIRHRFDEVFPDLMKQLKERQPDMTILSEYEEEAQRLLSDLDPDVVNKLLKRRVVKVKVGAPAKSFKVMPGSLPSKIPGRAMEMARIVEDMPSGKKTRWK